MTCYEIITAARKLLNDPRTGSPLDGTRWKDAGLIPWVDAAQKDLFQEMPHLFLLGSQCLVNDVTTTGTTLKASNVALGILARRVAAYAIMEDSEDKNNMERAAFLNK